ncbi:porin family protein [Joostella sp. CR20]|uniref:porin family protein n=1 Tax=Joostella sp. CR20 TaxID=2804312 RepID=UPI00313E47B8
MKKLFFIAVAALGFATTTYAQEISYGVKGGTNFSNLSGDNGGIDNYRVGLYGGVFAEFGLTDRISIQPEVLYSSQGAHETFKTFDAAGVTSEEYTMRLEYLNVPVMFKYEIYNGLNVQVGPQIGFLLNAEQRVEAGNNGYTVYDETVNINEYITDVNFGVNFGLGYEFNNGLFFDGRYNLGVTNIAQEDNLPSGTEFKNHTFQVGVGYKF